MAVLKLGWNNRTPLQELVRNMVEADMWRVQNRALTGTQNRTVAVEVARPCVDQISSSGSFLTTNKREMMK